MSKLRIGVLGAARIAGGFVYGVRGSARVEVVAVASRSQARADAFAEKERVPRTLGSYEELLRDPDVDAIYNPLPNGLHAAWSIAAARAGKHVLCEKPLAAGEADGRAMFEAAAAAGVVLLEAFPYQFQPQTLEVERLIATGALGSVRSLQASFGFPLSGDARDVRLDAALAGGALMDVGCYPVSLARQCFGTRPLFATAIARWAESGVDRALAGTLEYEGGGLAQIACSFETAVHRQAVIAGTLGAVETGFANHTEREEAPFIRVKRGTGWEDRFATVPVPRANGFLLEADAFAEMVAQRGGPAFEARRAASLDNLATLTALLTSARTNTRVAVAPR